MPVPHRRRWAFVVGGALVVALVAAGCGGSGNGGGGAKKTTAQGLRAAGLVRCAGPVPAVDGASVSLFAASDFAAVLARGDGATQDAIALAQIRHRLPSGNAAEVARREQSWRATALRALRRSDAPPPCGRELARLPVLAETEVVCPDAVLIPLGERAANDTFMRLLRTLYRVKVTLQPVRSRVGRYSYITRYDQQVSESRPYCG
jgi:hypothetical protein